MTSDEQRDRPPGTPARWWARARSGETVRTIRHLLLALPGAGRALTFALLLTTVATGLLPLVQMWLTSLAIGSLPDAVRDGTGSEAYGRLVVLVIGLAAAFFASQMAAPLQFSVSRALGTRLEVRVRHRVIDAHLRAVEIDRADDPALRRARSLARDLRTITFGPSHAVGALSRLVSGRIHGLSAAAVLATFTWWAPLVLLLTFLPWDRYFRNEHAKMAKGWLGRTRAQERAEYFRDLAFDPATGKEIRVFGLAGFVRERFAAHYHRAMRPFWQGRRTSVRRFLPVVALVTLGYLTVYGWLGYTVSMSEVSLTHAALYIQVAGQIWRIVPSFNDLSRISIGAGAVAAAAQLPDGHTGEPKGGGPPPVLAQRPLVRFEKVAYRYPSADTDVLSGVDLEIPFGGSLAVVGENGAGKSTLIRLLCGLATPTGGRITVDGRDLADLDAASWHRGVAAVFQDFVRFPFSARENIAVGTGGRASEHAVAAAAEQAGAGGTIARLPKGMDTVLSREFSGGSELSGGQWQSIAVARAMARVMDGARLLVLDEPTANLDVRAEAEMIDRVLDLDLDLEVTTVLVSHRFANVRRADRIVVLDGGRITESGSHDQLMRREGQYARMFRLQAARFESGDAAEGGPDVRGEEDGRA
ncbi:ABC transporter ATP-binding protein [Streptomyces sulphureus]|uniref:ABC transporter ATP-binding protein n=1 Tax=Streptomyces sulphureus TaxID=47758 RepID=UPI0003A9BF57|nr:ABC transporter ATP-binding protein [Streptomyces sulphureus]